MERHRITIVGSCNTDLVIRVDHLPKPGETIIGHDFMTNQGGKGANQAVAVARLGGEACFVARVGDDGFGRNSLDLLKKEGIQVDHVSVTPDTSTGIALIPVDAQGENSIIVSSGANALLSEADIVAAAGEIRQSKILLMQLETPVGTLIRAARIAHDAGVTVVLNPAPYPKQPLPDELLSLVDIITPNETEAAAMSGIEVSDDASILKAMQAIRGKGIRQVIMTAGSRGAYLLQGDSAVRIPTEKTHVVDTTAAGDTFCGALCVALSEDRNLQEAVSFANRAASLSVTRVGAWHSIPNRDELK